MPLLLLNEDELRQVLTVAETIEAVKAAFVAQAEHRLGTPGSFNLNLPKARGEVKVKGAYLSEAPYFFIRVASKFPDNSLVNLPEASSLLAVFDATTGFPAALLLDNGYLSQMRAGAAGALAASLLANPSLDQVAVIGSGNQAYVQLKALMAVRPVGSVSVWGRSPDSVDSYARRIVEDHDLDITIAPSVEAAVSQADLIITATASPEPLIRAEWLKPGVHITAVGSNDPAKQELFPGVLRRADVLIVDSFEQCAAAGETFHGLAAGLISRENIQGELGELVIGKIPGRTHPDQVTLADLTGLDVQDAAVARVAVDKALFLGLGQQIASPL